MQATFGVSSEDEYAVAAQCDTIVCDDWETVNTAPRRSAGCTRTASSPMPTLLRTSSRWLPAKNGRTSSEEWVYFNAVGLAYVDVAIAHAMFRRAKAAGRGQALTLQQEMIFEHQNLADVIRM